MKAEIVAVPFKGAEEMLNHLADIFGEEERELERVQLLGEERDENIDIVARVFENGTLLGAVHATIPQKEKKLAGISAMFTTREARGKGIGKLVFDAMMTELEKRGVTDLFLGTSEPIAEKLYASFGFRYLYGSGVMMKNLTGAPVDFFRERFGQAVGKIAVGQGNADMRIPIVPLALSRLDGIVYEANLEIANPAFLTQASCMGLYPRYLACRLEKGDYFSAADERGVLGATATYKKMARGEYRVDGFCVPSFDKGMEELLSYAISRIPEKEARVYMDIAETDVKKQAMARAMGFSESSKSAISIKGFSLPAIRYDWQKQNVNKQ